LDFAGHLATRHGQDLARGPDLCTTALQEDTETNILLTSLQFN